MSAEFQQVKEIFLAAVDKADLTERKAWLWSACGDDEVLRRRIEALLEKHDGAGAFLEPVTAQPTGNPCAYADARTEAVGTKIGPYRLLQQLGEGGMGVVYLAEQEHPIKRHVALKVIKAGMGSAQVSARFEQERQALELMDHPHIAKVLDAGMTDASRPYFVMELVEGVPVTTYCDQKHLTPRERLELFIPICQAVQHAHQKGVIHRDLKPSNVLVALYDGVPVPKVIDFGVAKATGRTLAERSLYTEVGVIVGTLEYMAPEQAELNNLDIDTRADIYSLGVLLYELLTGSTPFSAKQLRGAGFSEMLRMIKEVEPPKPSTRLSSSDEIMTVAAKRNLEPARLRKLIKGELDWMVMKCLEKDRGRRYESANDFAADVQRFLTDAPVQACPPSAFYRFRKFARRNKAALVTVSVVSVAILAGSSVAIWQAIVATRATQDALAAEADTRTERDKAVSEKERANEEAAIAQAVNNFLLNDLLFQAAPERNARDRKVSVEELLGRAADRIGGRFDQQPRIEAGIRDTIGRAYRGLGNYPAAQAHLERALEVRRHVFGDEHPQTLASMNNLAGLYRLQGRFAKAELLFVKALDVRLRDFGDEDSTTLIYMNNLALLYQARGHHAKAEPLHVKTLEVRRRILGEEHPGTLAPMNNLAILYQAQGHFAKAEALLVKALDISRRDLGEEHPDTLSAMNNLAALYQAQGQFGRAEPLYFNTLDVSRRVLGEEHPDTLRWMSNLAAMRREQGQLAEAEPVLIKTLDARCRILGEEHPDTLRSMNNLAVLHQDLRRLAEAEPLFVKTLEVRRRILGEEHPDTLTSMNRLAALYQAQGHFGKAEPLLLECLAIREKTEPDGWATFNTKSMLGGSLLGQKKYPVAEQLLLDGYVGMKQHEAAIPWVDKSDLAETVESLVRLYDVWDKPAQAAHWRAKLPAKEPSNNDRKRESN